MFSYLLRQLFSGMGAGVRVIRAYISRLVMGVWTRIKRLTQVARGTTRVLGKATKTISQVGQKPSKREDFIETRSMYISKSFLILAVLIVIALAAIVYFLVVPWAVSNYGTARMVNTDSKLAKYDGRVIVYYDKDKTVPEYEGYLKDGKLEGEGRQYNLDGELVYVGNFVTGMREGFGEEYEEGMLVYSGSFSADQYEGEGKLFQNGLLSESGAFSGGKLNGEGFAYYTNGAVYYNGLYVNGERTGSGTSYYSSGGRQYAGEFIKGVYSGSGTLYDERGSIRYSGAFEDGVYSGSGVLFLENGFRMSGEFEKGEVSGPAQIEKGGYVYYTGSVDSGRPSGYGTLYSMSGDTVYEGPMLAGTIDGSAMLGLDADTIRGMLGDSTLETKTQQSGFTLTAKELGLAVFFSFQTDEEDSSAYDVCIARTHGADSDLSALLWQFSSDTSDWISSVMTGDYSVSAEAAYPQYAAACFAEGEYDCTICRGEDSSCILWAQALDCFMLQWTDNNGLTVVTGEDTESSQLTLSSEIKNLNASAGRMTLELPASSQYGTASPASVLRAAKSKGNLYEAADAMLEYWNLAGELETAEAQLALYQKSYAAQQKLVKTGEADKKSLSALEEQITALQNTKTKCSRQLKDLADTVKTLTGSGLASTDLRQMTLLFSPEGLTRQAVSAAARAAAGKADKDETAQVSAATAALSDTQSAWDDLQSAAAAYGRASDELKSKKSAYQTGKATDSEILESECAFLTQQSLLYSAIADFSRQSLSLDELTGGLVADTYSFFSDIF